MHSPELATGLQQTKASFQHQTKKGKSLASISMPIVKRKAAIVPVAYVLLASRLAKMASGESVRGLSAQRWELMAKAQKCVMGRTMTAMARSMMVTLARFVHKALLVKMENAPPQNAELAKQNAKSPDKNNALT
jgi:hypothetical protein